MKFDKLITKRGFEYLEFEDSYGEKCTMQRSSNIDPNIWVGIDNPNPQCLVPGKGWIPLKLPRGTAISTRMHLTRKQSISLALKLLKFGIFNRI